VKHVRKAVFVKISIQDGVVMYTMFHEYCLVTTQTKMRFKGIYIVYNCFKYYFV